MLKLVILCGGLFLLAHPALAGWVSNGGGETRDQGNIWFLDLVAPAPAKPMEYCVEAATDFGQSEAELKEMVDAALRQWRKFFNDYQAHRAIFYPSLRFSDGQERRIALTFEEVATCSEERTDQIAFLFGKTNKRLDEYLQLDGEYSLAVALRRPYDHQTYRTGGYIWLSKRIGANALRTKHMLLHELGHAFGMPHNSVFVMDEHVADYVLGDDSRTTADLGKIETEGWFFRFQRGRQIHLTYYRPDGFMPNSIVPAELSERLGLNPAGSLRIKLHRPYETGIISSEFTLIFDELVGGDITTRTFDGKLELTSFGDLRSPGIYTDWLDLDGKIHSQRVSVGFRWEDFIPGSGFFTISNADGTDPINFAANLTEDRWPKLRLFLPQSAQWWTLN